jgi:hypothetical protein
MHSARAVSFLRKFDIKIQSVVSVKNISKRHIISCEGS